MQKLISSRSRAFAFAALFLALLAPHRLIAQQTDPGAFIWGPPDNVEIFTIDQAIDVGIGSDLFQTLSDNADGLADAAKILAAGTGIKSFKLVGKAFEVFDAIEEAWTIADAAVQDAQDLYYSLTDVGEAFEAMQFTGWNVNGFNVTTNYSDSGIPGVPIVSAMVLGYVNDTRTTDYVAASIPDVVQLPQPGTGTLSAPLPVTKIVNVGSDARISSLSIGAQVTSIAVHALDIASVTNFTAGSSYFNSVDGVLFNGDQTVLVRFPEGRGGQYVVPSSVTTIAANAFYNCSNLTSLVIGANVVQIYGSAFANSGLQEVYFGGNAPATSSTAFNPNSTCTVNYLPGFTGWGTSGGAVDFGGIQARLYNPFESSMANQTVTITRFDGWHNPASGAVLVPSVLGGFPVTSIAGGVFSYLEGEGVTNIVIPDSVTSIGTNAFDHCMDLQTIKLSTNLTSLGSEAFLFCASLTSLRLPNSLTIIPEGLVAYCSNLTTMVIGTKVTSIGYGAFLECERLFYLNFPATLTSLDDTALDYCGSLRVDVDPANPAYSNDRQGVLFDKSQTTLIHANSQALGSYTVPGTVVNINTAAFYGARISAVYVPAGVTYLGASAFANCANLLGAYFGGTPPTTEPASVNNQAFSGSANAVVYRLSNASGWSSSYAGAPVQLWTPYQYSTNNGALTLTTYSGPGGNVGLPGSINGLPVTAIQAGIFANPGVVSSLTLPDSVTSIADNAFSGLINLTSISFGNGVTKIGNNAFSGCSSLQNLVIPDRVTSIGSAAFSGCGLTNVTIGKGLTSLSDNLFSGCSLGNLTIPATVQHIGAGTFANNSMEYVVIPGSVTSLGASAFANCTFLQHAYFQGNAPANDGTAFSGDYDFYIGPGVFYHTDVQYLPGTTGWGDSFGGIPADLLPLYYTNRNGRITITAVGGRTGSFGFPQPIPGDFEIFSSINGVPVTGIADYAFANCQGLTSVIIPAGVTSIGAGPFMNCTNLTSLGVAAGNPDYASANNVLFNSARTILNQFPGGLGGSYQVPSTVTTIGAGAFYGSKLRKVSVPVTVTEIGSGAFAFCQALTNLAVAAGNPDFVSPGGVLFNAAQTVLVQFPGGLAGNYTVPSGVTSLAAAAFAASQVTSVVIPASVSQIPSGALAYCSSLTNIAVQAGNTQFASVQGVLEDAAQTMILQYPGGLQGDSSGNFTIGTNITIIGNLSFAGSALSSVTVPATVWSVGSSAFAGCAEMDAANFLGNAPSNDGTAFANSQLTVYYLASGTGWGTTYGGARTYEVRFEVQENGNHTLTITGNDGDPGLLQIPDNLFGEPVTAIGDYAFANREDLTALDIPSTVTSLGQYSFQGCNWLGHIILRNSANLSIGYAAFADCLSLTNVEVSGAPVAIGDSAFAGCLRLSSFFFTGITSIGNYAFYGCRSMSSLDLEDSPVTSIGAYAFAYCYLRDITLPASVKSLGSGAFAYCNADVVADGAPPASDGTAFANGQASIYFYPGTGWGPTYDGFETMAIEATVSFTVDRYGATITGLIVTGLPDPGSRDLLIPPSVVSPYSDAYVPVIAIAANAFSTNLSITNVILPDSLVSIGDDAFRNCSNLLSASLPTRLASIGNSAFQNCVNLRGVSLPQSVTNIGAYAFAGCPGETNLEFGAGLAFLGNDAFMGWANLQTVYFNGDAPTNNGPAFAGDGNALLYVLPGSSGWGTTYFGNSVTQWVQFYYNLSTNDVAEGQNSLSLLYGADSIYGPGPFNLNGVTNVSAILAGYAGHQSVVTVPSVINGWPVTSVGDSTFIDRGDVNSVILPNSITSIGSEAFKYCGLTNIVFSTNLANIGSDSFYGCWLTSVVLPDTLTNIPSDAFFLSPLTNVVLPKNLISIDDHAFSQCPLPHVDLPQTLQTIGSYAFDIEIFDGRGLTNVVFPNSLTSIGDRAFWGCPMSGTILIPPDVTFIGEDAFFSSVNGLSAVYFEGNAPATDYGAPFDSVYSYSILNGIRAATGPGIAFYDPLTFGWGTDYYGLTTVPWHPYSYTFVGNTVTITGYGGSGGALTVPGTIGGYPVTALGANAFATNESLTQITLPESITTVGAGAFAGSTNLVAIYFKGNAPASGADLFAGDNLSVYYLNTTTGWGAVLSGVSASPYAATGAITINLNPDSIGAKWQVDSNGPFYAGGATATKLSVGSHVVNFSTVGGQWQTPNNITLYVGAFQGTLITIPYEYVPFNYVTNGNGTLTITGYLGNSANIYIPATINGMAVTGIAASAFTNLAMQSVVMPDSLTAVGTNAFANCPNLVTVTVSSGVTSLTGSVFANCPKLTSVFFDGNAPATDGTLFTGDNNVAVYHVSGTTGWSGTFATKSDAVVPYTFTVSGNAVTITGYNGTSANLAIPATIGGLPVTDIYASVFQNNLSLTNVTIPDSVISIEFQAFAGCSNLKSVDLGTNVQWIGPLAFINCTSLASIGMSNTFPDSLQQIYQQAFYNDVQLTNINLGNGLQSIGDEAGLGSDVFGNCTNLSGLTFGNNVTNIGPQAFAGCSALTNLTFPDGLLTIESGAFGGCTGVTNLDFGTNLFIIGDQAFSGCTGLTNLVLPPNIYLGTNAFAFCSQLRTVFFSGMMQYIDAPYVDAFYNDTSAVVYYPTAAAAGGWRSPNFATSDYRAAIAYSVAGGNTVSIDHYAANGGSFDVPYTLGGLPVTSVASNAFAGYVVNLTIGPGVLSIGALSDPNYGGNTIVVDPANPNYSSVGGVLLDKSQTTLIRYPTGLNSYGSYTVPATVTNIADYAFEGCQVTSVTLSSNITTIGNGAFFGANQLSRLSNPAPDRLTFLGQSAFEGCSALTNFITGNNLPSIQDGSFANCTQLKSVSLGRAVGSIGIGAFSNCVSLASINLPSALGSIGDGAFGNCQSLTTLTVPAGVPAGTNYYSIRLGSGVFAGCSGLKSAYFLGNAPYPDYGNTFAGDGQLTVYFPTESLGWSTTFDGTAAAAYAPFGSLQVSFNPSLAGQAWRVDGGVWLTNDGTPATLVISPLSAGSHTVSFGAVNGFYTPPDQVVVLSNLSVATATATYVQTPVSYTVNAANSITITGALGLNADGFLVVPPSINGVPVTDIGGGAFYNNQSLVGVILPSTVTNLGDTCFLNCANLATVVFGTNLAAIGNSAFQGCSGLQAVMIPDSVVELGQGAFAFCTSLTSVEIGSGITNFGYNTFNGDSALTTLFCNGAPPADLSFVTNFYPQLIQPYSPTPPILYNPAAPGWSGITAGYVGDWTSLFAYGTNSGGGIVIQGVPVSYDNNSIVVPSAIGGLPVTEIGTGAFADNNFSQILLPRSVSSIDANAFFQSGLANAYISANVTNIGSAAYAGNGQLSELIVDPANTNYCDVNGVLYNQARTELITVGPAWGQNSANGFQFPIPAGVTKIDADAFYGQENVSRIILPATVSVIEPGAFAGIYSPAGLTNITVDPANPLFASDASAFFTQDKTTLIQFFTLQQPASYTVPSGVRVIADGAFKYQYYLNGVVLPQSLKSIGAEAFNASGIGSLTVPNSVTNIGEGAFEYCNLTNLVLPAGLTVINSNLCLVCRNLTSINLPAGVTNIGDFAFASTGLTQVILPAGLTHLGYGAFQSSQLTSVVLPDHLTDIGGEVFDYCRNLISVTFGASVTNVGYSAFADDGYLQNVVFDTNLVSISSNAFQGCQYLGGITFPASLAFMGVDAFQGVYMSALFLGNAPATNGPVFDSGRIYFVAGTTGWGSQFGGVSAVDYDSQFSYNQNPDGTLTITGCNVYYGDLRLPARELGQMVTGIAAGAFAGDQFANIFVPATITNIDLGAFNDCSATNFVVDPANPAFTSDGGSLYDAAKSTLYAPVNLPLLILPATVTNISLDSFDLCYYLTNISVNPANPAYSAIDGVLFDKPGTTLVRYSPGAPWSHYLIPDSVQTIGTKAFAGSYIPAIVIPASVTSIQPLAIANSPGVRSVYFQGAAPSIDPSAFTNDPNAILFYLSPSNAAGFAAAGIPAQEWTTLFNWVTNGGNTISITGYNDPGNKNYVLFPDSGITGLPVVDVGTAFAQPPAGSYSGLTGIVLPPGVTSIADNAFTNSRMGEVVLPANLASIGSNAFGGCRLYYVTLPAALTNIGDWAFSGNGLSSLVIPAGVKVIGDGVFSFNGIAQATLPDSLLRIGDYAFAENELDQINIPATVTNIGAAAFQENNLTNLVIPAGITSIEAGTFQQNRLVSVALPAGLQNIDDSAFAENYLNAAQIPEGVTNIGPNAFASNYELQSVQFPNTLVSLGDSAFRETSLSSLVIPASVVNIGDSTFAECNLGPAYFLGNAPTNTAGNAFDRNDTATVYYLAGTTGWGSTFGDAPTYQLPSAGAGSTNADDTLTLTNYVGTGDITLPPTLGGSAVTVIGSGAFSLAGSGVTGITLPSGVAAISSGAFAGCSALTTIVIPNTVSNIDIDAFAGCPGLTNIIVAPGNPYFSSVNGVLFDQGQAILLACGGGVTGNYVIPTSVTAIGTDAFMGCAGLTNIVFPPGLTCIGDPAFADCDGLTTLTIPATVTNIGDYAFTGCASLKSIYFEGNAPPDDGTVFAGDVNATVYYPPSAIGFGATFGGVPAMPLGVPVAGPITVYRSLGSPVQISLASLAANWTDPNNAYPVTLKFLANTSTNFAPVVTNAGWIVYNNTNNVNDQIHYSVVDRQGFIGTGVINVVLVGSLGITHSGGVPTVSFTGPANQSCDILVSTNLVNWTVVFTGVTSANGILQFTDSHAPAPAAFYRARFQY